MTDYNVLDFGAAANGRTNDAAAIQKAIDACHAAGGGRVIFPAGKTCLSGTLMMRSNVELHLESGAVLQASPNVEDYTVRFSVGALTGGVPDKYTRGAIMFITAQNATNVCFSGRGVIDGGGRFFIKEKKPEIYVMQKDRPFTFFLLGCHQVRFNDLTIRDGAVWTIRLSGCTDVLIHAISIENDLLLPNSDAIDIDRCKDVRISDCNIVSGDDCIVLKTTQETEGIGEGCENVIVTGCTMVSRSIAVCVGCECRATMKNIIFDSCVIRDSHRGLAVRLSEGSDVENVIFSNMIVETRRYHPAWWGSGEPINCIAVPWDSERGIGRVKNVRFVNILCRSENGIYVEGWTPEQMQDVLFENVCVELEKWTEWPTGEIDRRPLPTDWAANPPAGFLHHPTAGFLLNKAQRVTLRNCEVVWGANCPDYFRHAVESHAVQGLVLEGFKGRSADPAKYDSIVIKEEALPEEFPLVPAD